MLISYGSMWETVKKSKNSFHPDNTAAYDEK